MLDYFCGREAEELVVSHRGEYMIGVLEVDTLSSRYMWMQRRLRSSAVRSGLAWPLYSRRFNTEVNLLGISSTSQMYNMYIFINSVSLVLSTQLQNFG